MFCNFFLLPNSKPSTISIKIRRHTMLPGTQHFLEFLLKAIRASLLIETLTFLMIVVFKENVTFGMLNFKVSEKMKRMKSIPHRLEICLG